MVIKSPIKKISPEKVAIVHVCTQSENIEKMNLILLGNGHPEDGLAYKVIKMTDDITAIKKGVDSLHESNHEAQKIATTALNAVEGYKKEMSGLEKGKDNEIKTKAERRADAQKTLQLIATIIMAVGLIITAYFGYLGNKKQNTTIQKVEGLGEPIVTTPRGVAIPLPADAQIKFYPKDFMDDTTIKK